MSYAGLVDLLTRFASLAEQMERQPESARLASERFADGFDDARSRLAFRVGCLEGAVTDYASDLRALIQILNDSTKERTS